MRVTAKGRITIPKHIRDAAGLGPGSEVSFGLEGRKIVITPVGKGVTEDRRAKLLAAAARVRESMSPEFRRLGAEEMMAFIRGEDAVLQRARAMLPPAR
jgi:antitoxin PrlF